MEDVELINERKTEDSIKEDRRWCVYIHRNKINNKCYIGQTNQTPEKRWGINGYNYLLKEKSGKYKHRAFANALLKYPDWDNDWEHIIFADNLSRTEANTIEIWLIRFYNTTNNSFGYNLTFGGESNVPTKEAIEKNRESHIGKPSPRKGVKLSQQTKDKISLNRKGKCLGEKNPSYNKDRRGKNNPMYGVRLCGIKGKRNKPVYSIEMQCIFWGAMDVEQQYKIDHRHIACCCKQKRKSCGKHPETGEKLHWLYAEDAIERGYITQQDLDKYLQDLRDKEKDNNGKTI